MKFRIYDKKAGVIKDYMTAHVEDDSYQLLPGSGLVDYFGTEIFHGHIICIPYVCSDELSENFNKVLCQYSQVVYMYGAFHLDISHAQDLGSTMPLTHEFPACIPEDPTRPSVEVVGNIFENKELLELLDQPYTGSINPRQKVSKNQTNEK
jgi:hypothetical protein